MNYKETCEYLYSQIPMFERQGASGYKAGLANTLALDEHFGHPHRNYITIHVGGTNGKGSVAHSIAAILQECGYHVGLYTSPHLVDFKERIRVNGQPVSENFVIDFVDQERYFFEPLHPSFFEVTTAMAFKYFSDMDVDIAVVEVGLGGRLDCTNIITPVVSIITNISLDHTQFLGDTMAKIAFEKAGIIKKGVPVVVGETTSETRSVFETVAAEKNTAVIFAEEQQEVVSAEMRTGGGMHYVTCYGTQMDGDLGGIYQKENLNTIFAALHVLADKGFLSVYDEKGNVSQEIVQGIAHVADATGLMGRWQVIGHAPEIICDAGHNTGGWQHLHKQLDMVMCKTMRIVFGMVNDKDVNSVLDLLPKQATYYFTKPNTPRGLDATSLLTLARQHGLHGNVYPDVRIAFNTALQQASSDDFIFIGGSCYLVGDFLRTCV